MWVNALLPEGPLKGNFLFLQMRKQDSVQMIPKWLLTGICMLGVLGRFVFTS